jgi:hypothetical protein
MPTLCSNHWAKSPPKLQPAWHRVLHIIVISQGFAAKDHKNMFTSADMDLQQTDN